MADGVPYVPLDCHFDDDKIPMIEAEFGLEGFAIVVKLFQKIYGGLGYYCEWNDRVALLFAKNIGAGGNIVREVVAASIREGIFDKGMFEKYGVLTSHGIQARFMKIAKRRKQIFSKPEYALVCSADFSEDVDISAENVCNSSENAYNSETSKVKQSKVNVSEVNVSKAKQSNGNSVPVPAAATTKEQLIEKYGISKVTEYEHKFCAWKSRQSGKVNAEMYSTIAKWMQEDRCKAKLENSSLDMQSVVDDVMAQYKESANG